jgi:Ca-activated chloride channel homolog
LGNILLYFRHSGAVGRILCYVFLLFESLACMAAQNRTQADVPASGSAPGVFIRHNVDVVLVNVTVLDRHDHVVAGLNKSDFTVFDNNSPTTLKYLSNSDEPVSVVVIFDASASMASKIAAARSALRELLDQSNAQDDFSVIVVNDKPRVAVDFGHPPADVLGAINAVQAQGQTALWDGVCLGLEQMRNSRNQRMTMVVISDGGDNHSRYTETELKRSLDEVDLRLYAVALGVSPAPPHQHAVGLYDPLAQGIEERKGILELDELSAVTGGRLFMVQKSSEISPAATQLSREIHGEYILGFSPRTEDRDGKWHKLKVRLSGHASAAKCHIYARKGYYAAAQ